MKGLHVNWTKPTKVENKINYFYDFSTNSRAEYFTKITAALSALWWKKLNGPIKLITDNEGLARYQETGLIEVYDSYDVDLLESYDGNPKLWTGGKIFSLGIESLPYVFLDNDLIIRSTIDKNLYSRDVGFTHWEIPKGTEYELKIEDIEYLGIQSNLSLDLMTLVTNTSFFYVNSKEFQDKMHSEHLLNYKQSSDKITTQFWMYTDQIIPGQIIRNLGLSYFTVDHRIHLPYSTQSTNDYKQAVDPNFTENLRIGETPMWVTFEKQEPTGIQYEHIWMFKAAIVKHEELYKPRIEFYERELKREFPEYAWLCTS